ncbi:MAG TPA: phosphotransferase [Candidatus Paceibacterota bacterium]
MEKLLVEIDELYGKAVTNPQKVTGGFLSENYFLQEGSKKYFLKKYRFTNTKRIDEVHASKKYFSDGGIPVILPIPLLNGSTYFSYDGSYYALFPFVDGKQIDRGNMNHAEIISLGEMLGRIHLLGKVSKVVNEERFKIGNQEKTFKKIEDLLIEIQKKAHLSDFDKIALENIELKKQLLLTNKLSFEDLNLPCDHLIHGDYLDHNVFFDDHHKVFAVFDFEKTNYSPRTYELFRSMIYGMISDDFSEKSLSDAKIYLDAYTGIYPISKDEIKRGLQLFLLKSIHGFWVESEHYIKNNNRVDEFLFNDYKKIKYLSENLEEFTRFLTT